MTIWSKRSAATPRALVAGAVVGILAVAGIGLAWGLLTGTDRSAGTDTSTDPAHSPVESRAASLPASPPADGVVLPAAAEVSDGFPVGFPHSDAGAAAAQVEFTRTQVGFDFDQAAAAARAYAAPSDEPAIAARAKAAVANRRAQLSVPAAGPAAAPAAFALTPFAFQVAELDTDFYAVTVLSLATTTSAGGEVRNLYYTGTQLVRWIDDDWKTVAGTRADHAQVAALPQPPAVGPKDPRYLDAGWITIKRSTS